MLNARFRRQLPDDAWIGDVSAAFPRCRFELLTGVPIDGGGLGVGAVVGPDPVGAGAAVDAHPDIREYEQLYADAERVVGRFEWVGEKFFNDLRAESIVPEFPVVIKNGVIEFDVTVTRDQFERIDAALDASEDEYDLVSVVGAHESESVLTRRQRECLAVALREGYFSVPRECTLADVAERIGVDKSTASKTIRRGSERVLEWFLVGENARLSR